MNNVFFTNYFTHTSLENQFIKNLNDREKRVIFIALAIFSTMAACFLIYQYSFKAKVRDQNECSLNDVDETMNVLQTMDEEKELIIQTPAEQKETYKEINASFPSLEAAKIMILSEDSFLKVLSPFDRQVRMQDKEFVSQEDFLSFYLRQVQECSREDKECIQQSFRQINSELQKYGIELPENIHFIRTTGKEEIPGTAAYCRCHNLIIFNHISTGLIAHELFHLYSRNQPEMRKKLYALIGYHLMPPLAIPNTFMSKRLVNPDVPYLDAYIHVTYQGTKVQAVPLDLYDLDYKGKGQNYFLSGIYHKFALLEQAKDGHMQFKLDSEGCPILFDFDEAEDLKAQIGENTSYIDSPEEILADNFALMILGKSGKSPELIEKMKACFKNLEEI